LMIRSFLSFHDAIGSTSSPIGDSLCFEILCPYSSE
jgi:hypothetical protein